jgi:hypothetical protein
MRIYTDTITLIFKPCEAWHRKLKAGAFLSYMACVETSSVCEIIDFNLERGAPLPFGRT